MNNKKIFSEVWDLYDKDRKKLEQTMYKGEDVPKGSYRLAVKLLVFNSEKKMLIQKRSSEKKEYPAMWDISVRGSVISGETSEEGIKRETKEELGIDIESEGIRPTLTIHDRKWFDDIYILKKDLDIHSLTLQKEEVMDVKWASEREVLQMIENNQFIPYNTNLMGLLFDKGGYNGKARRTI